MSSRKTQNTSNDFFSESLGVPEQTIDVRSKESLQKYAEELDAAIERVIPQLPSSKSRARKSDDREPPALMAELGETDQFTSIEIARYFPFGTKNVPFPDRTQSHHLQIDLVIKNRKKSGTDRYVYLDLRKPEDDTSKSFEPVRLSIGGTDIPLDSLAQESNISPEAISKIQNLLASMLRAVDEEIPQREAERKTKKEIAQKKAADREEEDRQKAIEEERTRTSRSIIQSLEDF